MSDLSENDSLDELTSSEYSDEYSSLQSDNEPLSVYINSIN